jgi:hypothetical protein
VDVINELKVQNGPVTLPTYSVPYAVLAATPTLVATATPPGNITATLVTAKTVVANGLTVNGSAVVTGTITTGGLIVNSTPAVPYSTPQMVSNPSVPIECVLGAATPFTNTTTITDHGLTTPLYAIPWLAQAVTGDSARVYSTISGITVTLGVANALQTPAANTTPATVKYMICGTK